MFREAGSGCTACCFPVVKTSTFVLLSITVLCSFVHFIMQILFPLLPFMFPVPSPPHRTPCLPHIPSPAAYLFLSLHPFRLPSTLLPCFILLHGPCSSSHPPLHLRLLEHQLQTQRRSYDNEVEALRGELQSVKEENNRQQQLLAQNLQLPPEARIEASLQHEITRLTNENLVRCRTHSYTYRLRERIIHTILSPHMYKYSHTQVESHTHR